MQTYVEQVLAAMETSTGESGWMYLDAGSNVRVGAGLLLAEIEAAQHLPFQLGWRAATRAEIAAEFHRVKALPPDLPATFYRKDHGPELEREMVDALVRTSLIGVHVELQACVPGFDELGVGAKMALLTLGYRAGPAEALHRWRSGETALPVSLQHEQRPAPSLAKVPPRQRTKAPARCLSARTLGFGVLGLGAAIVEWLHTS